MGNHRLDGRSLLIIVYCMRYKSYACGRPPPIIPNGFKRHAQKTRVPQAGRYVCKAPPGSITGRFYRLLVKPSWPPIQEVCRHVFCRHVWGSTLKVSDSPYPLFRRLSVASRPKRKALSEIYHWLLIVMIASLAFASNKIRFSRLDSTCQGSQATPFTVPGLPV